MFTQISRSQAAQVTNTARAGTPIRASARTDSRTVAPVVNTSSTTTTSAFSAIRHSAAEPGTVVTLSCRLCARSRGVKPTESRTPHHTRSTDTIRLSGSQLTAISAAATTGSPPRRRAATRRLGAGTSTSGRSARSRVSAPASARPIGAARSVRPLSLAANTARRAGPRYGPSAQHGTPGSSRGRTRIGGPVSVAAQAAHQPTPGCPQPAHALGRIRSRRVRTTRVCAHPPTRPGDQPGSTGTAFAPRPGTSRQYGSRSSGFVVNSRTARESAAYWCSGDALTCRTGVVRLRLV